MIGQLKDFSISDLKMENIEKISYLFFKRYNHIYFV